MDDGHPRRTCRVERGAFARLLERDVGDAFAGASGDHALGDGGVTLAPLPAAVEALGVFADDQEVHRGLAREQVAAGRRLA